MPASSKNNPFYRLSTNTNDACWLLIYALCPDLMVNPIRESCLYTTTNLSRGVAPDLIVYLGDLAWRAVGTIGGGELYTTKNDTGPDDANHAQHGLFILHNPQHPADGQLIENAQIYDILPTLLAHYGITAPAGLRGKGAEPLDARSLAHKHCSSET